MLLSQINYSTPMKAEHKKRYLDNWEYISAYIRHERAKNKCESCGLQNGLHIKRLPNNKYRICTPLEMEELTEFKIAMKLKHLSACKRLRITKINLSVAHLNFNESDNRHANLKALCQKCHNQHDRANNLLRQKGKRYYGSATTFPGLF